MDVVPGDLVLVRQKVFRTQHKIEDRRELPVYKVVEQCGESPLYKVQKIGGVGGERLKSTAQKYALSLYRCEGDG